MSEARKVLQVGVVAKLADLDPSRVLDLTTEGVCRQIFETPFIAVDTEGGTRAHLFQGPLEPLPARSGKNAFAGRLLPGLSFSDGSPVTLEEAAAAVRGGLLPLESGVEVQVEGERLVFEVGRSRGWLERSLSNLKCCLVTSRGSRLLGTGPFRQVSEIGAAVTELERNPHYRGTVGLDGVVYRHYPADGDGKPTRLVAALKSGEIDLTLDLTRVDPSHLLGFRQQLAMGYSTAFLFFNTQRAPFDDLRVRRTVAQAIDRLQFTQLFYQRALAFVASSLLPPALGRFADGLVADPAAAQAAIKDLAPARRELKLLTVWAPRPYLPDPQRGAQFLIERLAALGFQVQTVVPRTIEEFSEHLLRAEYDLVLAGWQLETLDPGEFLEVNLASTLIPEGERGNRDNNLGRYASAEMDQALLRYRDDASRPALEAILRLAARDLPVLPLQYGGTLLVHSPAVKNVRMMVEGAPVLAEAELAR
jgi:MarR-like DNA-binding transcriptional regulator SgrR of sgrS sRNA